MSPTETAVQHVHGHRERLRRRFLESGAPALAPYEMLELLLTFALPRRDVKPLAKALLDRFGSFKAVLETPPVELARVKGVGERTAVYLSALRAALALYMADQVEEVDLFSTPEAVASYGRAALEGERNECFLVLLLSSKNRLLRAERLAEGTIDRAAVYPRRVIEAALRAGAAALIFLHNHPSGDPAPSAEDKALTAALARAARAMDIAVHDHVIIGNGRHFSFRSAGLL